MGLLTLFDGSVPAAQTADVGLDAAAFSSNFAPMGQEAVFLCPEMLVVLGALIAKASAMIHSGNSTMQVDRPSGETTNPAAHTPERGPSSEAPNDSLDEVWIRAEEDYGLVRPEPGETAIAVHRQTSQRLAHAHETWDEIPVHFDMPPEAILSDIAFGYTVSLTNLRNIHIKACLWFSCLAEVPSIPPCLYARAKAQYNVSTQVAVTLCLVRGAKEPAQQRKI